MQTDASKKKNIFNKIFKKKLETEINLLHEDEEIKPLPKQPVEQKEEEEEAIIFTPDEDTMEMDFSEEEEKEGGEVDDNEEKEVQKTENPYEAQK